VDRRANVNVQGGEYGNTLQVAAWKGSKAVVQLLVDQGADINARATNTEMRSRWRHRIATRQWSGRTYLQKIPLLTSVYLLTAIHPTLHYSPVEIDQRDRHPVVAI